MHLNEPKNPRVILLEDHERIRLLLDRLVAAVRANDREASTKLWAKVEETLLKHLDVEEMFVFPALRDKNASEIDLLRKEHDAIRRQMGDIGLCLELHTARCEMVEEFCANLRAHAEREDALAYVQAGRSLSIGVARSIAARLKHVSKRSRGSALRRAPSRTSTGP
jgi:hemerythrin-like domain-containing protein